jgi:hypothetical protein
MLILVLGINIATAKDHRKSKKRCKSYKCKDVGIQKISSDQSKPKKHYFIRPIKHFGPITNIGKHVPKFRG